MKEKISESEGISMLTEKFREIILNNRDLYGKHQTFDYKQFRNFTDDIEAVQQINTDMQQFVNISIANSIAIDNLKHKLENLKSELDKIKETMSSLMCSSDSSHNVVMTQYRQISD